jgi:PAS domain-containing protein
MAVPALTLPADLIKGLLQHVPVPLLVIDVEGTLLYYNDRALVLLGKQRRDAGSMSIEAWSGLFLPSDDYGLPCAPEEFPVVIALTHGRPAHQRVWTTGPDRLPRELEVSALPIQQGGQITGALVLFWPC